MRVLLTWELGGNMGHLASLSTAARALAARGHEVWLAVPDLKRVHAFVEPETALVVHGPSLPRRPMPRPPRTWADVLSASVFADGDLLANGLRAWRALLDAIRPDAMVFDAAPMALLATRNTPLRRVCFDSGWAAPPGTSPLPGIGDGWTEADRCAADDAAMAVVRAGCKRARIAPPPTLAGLLDADVTLVRTFPELAHYPAAPGRDYVGPILFTDRGVPARWPDVDGERVFAYLSGRHPATVTLLDALARQGLAVLAHVPDLDPRHTAALTAAGVTFSEAPVRMGDVLGACALGVCHSMAGTGAAFLLAGTPVLVPPMYAEQGLNAQRAEAAGLATGLSFNPPPGEIRRRIRAALGSDAREAARAFAERHQAFDRGAPIARLCEAVEGVR